MVTLLILSIVAGGAMLTAASYTGGANKKNLLAAELDMLNIAMAASLYEKLEGKPVPGAETLFNGGYLLGDNLSPFKTPYILSKKEGRMYIHCTGPRGETIGDRE